MKPAPALERNELALRGAFLEIAPDAVVIVDTTGRIVLVNAQTEKLFGYARDELLGNAVECLVPTRLRGRHSAHRDRYNEEPNVRGMGTGLDLHGVRKDGTEFPIEISLSPLQTERGRFVASAIRDVTERKRADEMRFRLAAIVDSSDDAIVGKTVDGTITSWNHGAERVFGYTADEAVGQPVTFLMPAGARSDESDVLARLRTGERVAPFEGVRQRKDGREIHVSITLSAIRDGSGRMTGASQVARDITDKKLAEEALARAKALAEATSQELEAFSYSVAHDLRAPLRSLDGFSLAVLEDYGDKLDDEGRQHLTKVRAAAQYMAHLIEALLGLARITRSELERTPVDLSALARATVTRLQAADPTRHVEVRIQEQLSAVGDGRLLGVAFDNLIGNAWKFASKRNAPRIEVGRSPTPEGEAFFVRDNGAGFDMAYLPKLFGLFQRLHSPNEFEGTGIGLATVQRIVRRHGGRIWATGQVDQGATFYFTLPERT